MNDINENVPADPVPTPTPDPTPAPPAPSPDPTPVQPTEAEKLKAEVEAMLENALVDFKAAGAKFVAVCQEVESKLKVTGALDDIKAKLHGFENYAKLELEKAWAYVKSKL